MVPKTTEREWRIFAAWVTGDVDRARAVLREGRRLDDPAFREMLLMLHLFAGVPRTLEACALVVEESPSVLPPPPEELRREGDEVARGWRAFEGVYGDRATAVHDRLQAFHGDLAHWIIAHAYGRVLGRPGLEFVDRELLAVAGLVALGTELQLESHARGALRAGASWSTVRRVHASLEDVVATQRWNQAARRLDRIEARVAGEQTPGS